MGSVVGAQLDDFRDGYLALRENLAEVAEPRSDSLRDRLGRISGEEDPLSRQGEQQPDGLGRQVLHLINEEVVVLKLAPSTSVVAHPGPPVAPHVLYHVHEVESADIVLPPLVGQEGVVDRPLLSSGEELAALKAQVVGQLNVAEVGVSSPETAFDHRVNLGPHRVGRELAVLPLHRKAGVELLLEDFVGHLEGKLHVGLLPCLRSSLSLPRWRLPLAIIFVLSGMLLELLPSLLA